MKSHARNMEFETGQTIPQSGSYSVFHKQHHLRHEVTLLKQHTFPACARCAVPVHFDLLHAVHAESARDRFRLLMHAH
jgi:hypothetical protein